ncbi:MAG: pyridoxal-phosphate dependent enzyme [Phycisphaerales bacterium]|nr:pyridoxal-phosphate dependent enzyme [Phycisphaerales bacterium]
MDFKNTILDAIGNTPLVRLNKVVLPNSATLLAKCEFMNPAGSIKDRMAYWIIQDAEKKGLLKPGGTVVENTSGNTGLGAAMTAAVKGYKCVFTMPDKMSQEKINMLKAFGAEVVITPTDVPGDSPEHYVNTAKRIAAETPGAFYLNQYHSPVNIEAHYNLTGPEIWRQTEGKLDAFVAGTGTGGTVSGTSRFLKEKKPGVRIIGVDPVGSVHYGLFHTGMLPTAHVYKVEGLGEDIPCEAMDFTNVDDMRQTTDKQAFTMARRLVREEGLFCGGSAGAIVHVAVRVAQEMGPGKIVVCVLPDSGSRYITKFLSDTWMKDFGFLDDKEELGFVEEVLHARPHEVVTARATDPVSRVVELFASRGISQVPVVSDKGRPESIVHEVDVLRGLHSGKISPTSPVRDVAKPVGGLIYPKARIEELYQIFEHDQVAIVVDNGAVVGVLSQIDLIEFLTKHKRNGAA